MLGEGDLSFGSTSWILRLTNMRRRVGFREEERRWWSGRRRWRFSKSRGAPKNFDMVLGAAGPKKLRKVDLSDPSFRTPAISNDTHAPFTNLNAPDPFIHNPRDFEWYSCFSESHSFVTSRKQVQADVRVAHSFGASNRNFDNELPFKTIHCRYGR